MNTKEGGFSRYVHCVVESAPLWLVCVSGCSLLLSLAGVGARGVTGMVQELLIVTAVVVLFALMIACGVVGARQRRLWLTVVGAALICTVPSVAGAAWRTLMHQPMKIGAGAGLWAIATIACVMFAVAAHGLTVQARRLRPKRNGGVPVCEKCGYNLTGNASGRCPECGTPTGPEQDRRSDRLE